MAEATGRLERTERGVDLVLVRSLSLSAEEAWAYLTESEFTEMWFGPWEGDARAGGSVRIRMRFEAGEPPIAARIAGCVPPGTDGHGRLELHTSDEYGDWRLTLEVAEDGGSDSLVTFTHHLDDASGVGEIGPGWEYYLDLLVAATEGAEEPMFHDYEPLGEAYAALRA